MNNDQSTTPWWRDRTQLTLAVFLAIAAYFLWTEHEAHVIEFLPWILIVGCVGMHLFMHGGHSHGGGHGHDHDGDREAKNRLADHNEGNKQ